MKGGRACLGQHVRHLRVRSSQVEDKAPIPDGRDRLDRWDDRQGLAFAPSNSRNTPSPSVPEVPHEGDSILQHRAGPGRNTIFAESSEPVNLSATGPQGSSQPAWSTAHLSAFTRYKEAVTVRDAAPPTLPTTVVARPHGGGLASATVSCTIVNDQGGSRCLSAERRDLLVARLHRDGKLVARNLAQELGLSDDSLRRDLREMSCRRALPASLRRCAPTFTSDRRVRGACSQWRPRASVGSQPVPQSSSRRGPQLSSAVALTALAVASALAPESHGNDRDAQSRHCSRFGQPRHRGRVRVGRSAAQAGRKRLRGRHGRGRQHDLRRHLLSGRGRYTPKRSPDDRGP